MNPPPAPVGLALRTSRPMRDSGVEWIGQVPDGWRVERNKNCYACSKDIVGEDSANCQLLSLTTQGVKEKGKGVLGGKLPESFDTYQRVRNGEMVMCLFDMDCSAVFSGLSHFDGMISPAYKVLTCKANTDAAFADLWFRIIGDRRLFKHYAKNIRYSLNWEDFAVLPMLLPPLSAQRAIAAYLDARCGEIEAAVAAARQSIEDYKALKKSLVFEAVTGKRRVEGKSKTRVEVEEGDVGRGERVERGEETTTNFTNFTNCTGVDFNAEEQRSRGGRAGSMNPPPAAAATSSTSPYQNLCNPCNPWLKTARPMRDSGVDPARRSLGEGGWIGAVPEGWRVVPLRRLGNLANGISKGGEFFGRGTPFVSYSDVFKNDVLPFEVKGLVEADEEERQRYSVERGDVLFTRTSETVDEIGIAAACLKTIPEATFAGFLIRFRPNGNQLLPEFSRYYFRNKSVSEFFAKELCIVTRASLGQERLKSLPVMIPPVEEQRAIADYLDEKCGAIDALVAEKESLIADLEQYKKSLIFECVTGKKKVEKVGEGGEESGKVGC